MAEAADVEVFQVILDLSGGSGMADFSEVDLEVFRGVGKPGSEGLEEGFLGGPDFEEADLEGGGGVREGSDFLRVAEGFDAVDRVRRRGRWVRRRCRRGRFARWR